MNRSTQRVFAFVLLLGVIALNNYLDAGETKTSQTKSSLIRLSSN